MNSDTHAVLTKATLHSAPQFPRNLLSLAPDNTAEVPDKDLGVTETVCEWQ